MTTVAARLATTAAARCAGHSLHAWQLVGAGALLVAACVVPFVVSNYHLFQLTMVVVYAIAILGLNMLTGFNGQISLGHGAFYAIGAYTTAILIDQYDVPYWATCRSPASVCLVVGFLFGLPALRLGGLYLALTTFALAVAMPQILKTSASSPGPAACRASSSIKPDPPFGLPLVADQWLYFFSLVVAVLLFLLGWNLLRGRIGRAMMAIRDHPLARRGDGHRHRAAQDAAPSASARCTPASPARSARSWCSSWRPTASRSSCRSASSSGWWSAASPRSPARSSARSFIEFVPNIAEQMSKAAPGAVYGVILIAFMYPDADGRGRAACAARPRALGGWRTGGRPTLRLSPSAAHRKEETSMTADATALVASPAAARWRWRPGWPRPRAADDAGRHRDRDQDRQHHALQRPGLGLRHHRQGRGRLLQDGQRPGRRQRPQDQLHLLDDGYSPPKTVEQIAPAGRAGQGRLPVQHLGTPTNTAIQKYINAKKVPQLFVATGADKWGDSKDFPWTIGWQPELPDRGADLRQVHPEGEARRQDRRALPERRFRQGLPRPASRTCSATSSTR